MTTRQEKVVSLIRRLCAEYLATQSDTTSLITITHVTISKDFSKATLFISVYPEMHEEKALFFAKRKRTELRDHLKKHTKLKVVPLLEVVIDQGEKNRQHVEELIEEEKSST